MYSNYPENNEMSSSLRPDMENRSFTHNIKTRVKNFFKSTKQFINRTTLNLNGIEENDDYPGSPPCKKMRLNYPGTSVSYTSSAGTSNVSTNTDSTEFLTAVQAGIVRTPTPPHSAHKEEKSLNNSPCKQMRFNFPSTSSSYTSIGDTRNVSTNTDSSEFLTPVQAGIVNTPTPSTYSDNKEEKSNYNHRFSLSNNFNSVTRKRKSLFDTRDEDRPAHGSTFYPGETVYGGASSFYMNRPNIKNKTNIQLSNHKMNQDINISLVTKRIYNLLEDYSCPVLDAKKITPCTKNKNSTYKTSVKDTAKTQGLPSQSLANILEFKRKAKLRETTQFARQLIASQSSSVPYIMPKHTSANEDKTSKGKFTTKIKSKLSKPDRGILVNETQPSLELPSNTLEIDMNNLPTFSPISSKPLHKEKNPLKINTSDTTVESDSITKLVDLDKWRCPTYTFKNNNPNESCVCCGQKELKNTESSNTTILPGSIINPIDFDKWRCPTCMIKNDNSIESCVCCGEKKLKKTESSNTTVLSGAIPNSIDLDKWRCPTCMIKNDNSIESCVCCGEKKPKKTVSSNTTFLSGAIPNPIDFDKWRCPSCMIKNDNSIESCVCCGEAKPKNLENMAVVSESITKPNISFANENMSIAAPTLSATLVDSQKDKWECPGCYVRNEKNVNKCVCCETNKPGVHGITQIKGFNFSQTNKTVFKFGINPKDYTKPEKQNIEVAVCHDNNLSKPNEVYLHKKFTIPATTVAATENALISTSTVPAVSVVTSRPVASAAPLAIAAFETSLIHAAAAEPEVSAASVTAAEPEVYAAAEVAAAPIFAAVPEVPAVPIAATSTDADNNGKQTSKLPEYFQNPAKSIAIESTNTLESPIQYTMNATSTINKGSSTNPLQIASASTEAQNKFSFPKPPPQGLPPPVLNVITPSPLSESPFLNIQVSASSSAADVSTASNLSKISYVSNPVTTSQSFFENTNLISNPAPSTPQLFKKSETTTIGASNPSIFSFGNNTQNSQPQSGSSKFNFTFTKKNPGSQSIFSTPSFGSQPSNNIAGNRTFNLAVQNENDLRGDTGMMNNILPGRTLSTGNSLESRTPSIFNAPPFRSQSSNNIAGNRTFNLVVKNENGSSGDTGMMNNVLPGNALSTGNSLESRTPSIFSAPPFGSRPSNNIADNRTFNLAGLSENSLNSDTGMMKNILPGNPLSTGNSLESRTPSIFSPPPFGSQPSNNIAGNRTFNLAVQNENGSSSDTGMMNNILPGNALSTGNSMESRTSSIFRAPPFGSLPSNNIAGTRTFNLAVQNENGSSSDTGMMNNILPGNALSTGNSLESRTPSIFSVPPFGSPRSNNVLTGDNGVMNNSQMVSENNLLGGPSSHSSGFHTQMNRDVWPPSNSSVNSFSFTGNTSFNSHNSATALPTFTQTQPPQNIFGSQTPANAGGIFGAPRMPSTVVPTVPTFDRNFAGSTISFGVGAQTNNGPFGQTLPRSEQAAVYNFGGQPNSMVVPQVQFNMGTSPGTPARRVRKAIRRTTQR